MVNLILWMGERRWLEEKNRIHENEFASPMAHPGDASQEKSIKRENRRGGYEAGSIEGNKIEFQDSRLPDLAVLRDPFDNCPGKTYKFTFVAFKGQPA
jgi:hypothetical protein